MHKNLKHRARRCDHGFYKGLCTDRTCPHWDRVQNEKEAMRTIVHEGWGKSDARQTRARQH